ncbi:MAG: hypothetical protein V3R94_08985 [Acidobacteriota bacterium]
MGKRIAILGVLLVLCGSLRGGNTIRIGGKGFILSLTEPDGWKIDFGAAVQLANFVMHPASSSWRKSSVVAFGRFTPRGADQKLEAFVDRDAEEFQKTCPFYEIQELDLKVVSSRKYLVRTHSCPGQRDEIVAVTEVPGFFVTFVLSSNHRDSLESAIPPFKEMLASFHWEVQPSSARPPEPKPR